MSHKLDYILGTRIRNADFNIFINFQRSKPDIDECYKLFESCKSPLQNRLKRVSIDRTIEEISRAKCE